MVTKNKNKLPLHKAIATMKGKAKKPQKQGRDLLRDLTMRYKK